MMSSVLRRRIVEATTAVAVLLMTTGGCGRSGNKPDNKAVSQPASDFVSKIETIKQAGEPVVLADLDAWYPTPPSDQNAAPLYAEAFAALVETDAESPSFLTKNQKALGLLHQATTRTRCRYPFDLAAGASTELPHLAKFQICAQLLREAAIRQATNGRMDLAAQAITDGLSLAASLEQEPLLISQMIRMAVLHRTLSALGQVLGHKTLTESRLAEIQAALQGAEQAHAGGFARCLIAERCVEIALFTAPPKEFTQSIATMRQFLEAEAPTFEVPDLTDYQSRPSYAADVTFYLDQMNDLIHCAKSSFPFLCQLTNAWESKLDEAARKGYVLSGFYLPSMPKAIERSAMAVAKLRTAQASLAVERFRSANNNRLPDSLPQLVPQFLVSVPADPFDGMPLQYKRSSPKGFVIYSVGPNRRDDDGTPGPPTGQGGTTNWDVTFVIPR